MRPFATYLTLRLTHESSDPSTVTHLLERIPTRALRANQVIQLNGRTKMIKRSAWILSSEEHVNSVDIDDHVQWMMDQMKGQRENVLRLNDSGWAIALNVMWDSQTGHGGPWDGCPRSEPPSRLIPISLGPTWPFVSTRSSSAGNVSGWKSYDTTSLARSLPRQHFAIGLWL
jgi:hypothetical protein